MLPKMDSRNFEKLDELLTGIENRARKIKGSYTLNNWKNLECGYVIDQLCELQMQACEAIALVNDEVSGSTEGAPKEVAGKHP